MGSNILGVATGGATTTATKDPFTSVPDGKARLVEACTDCCCQPALNSLLTGAAAPKSGSQYSNRKFEMAHVALMSGQYPLACTILYCIVSRQCLLQLGRSARLHQGNDTRRHYIQSRYLHCLPSLRDKPAETAGPTFDPTSSSWVCAATSAKDRGIAIRKRAALRRTIVAGRGWRNCATAGVYCTAPQNRPF